MWVDSYDNDSSLLTKLGFPGSMTSFERRMNDRRSQVGRMLQVGNPAKNIFNEFWDKVKDHTEATKDILIDQGYTW